MSIKARKLTNGKTVYDVQVAVESRDGRGRRRKITRTYRTKQQAIAAEAVLKVEAAAGGVRDSRRTVGDLLDAWFDAGEWSPRTRYDYGRIIERELRGPIGGIRLDQLGPRRLERLYRDMRARGLAPRTVRNAHRLLSVALATGVRWGWIPANVADRASVGHTGGPVGRAATLAEINTLLAAADDDMRLVIRLAVVTGARRSELCALAWSDVDFTAGTVTISRAVVEAGGLHVKDTKTHAARTIPLDKATLDLLKARRGIGPILGMSPTAVSKRFRALCRRTGIEGLGLHGFRHFSATHLLGSHDPKTVAGRGGWRDTSVLLNTYAHQLAERDRAAAEDIGAIFGS